MPFEIPFIWISSFIVAVLWWGWLLYRMNTKSEDRPFAGYLGALAAFPIIFAIAGLAVGLLVVGACKAGIAPDAISKTICPAPLVLGID